MLVTEHDRDEYSRFGNNRNIKDQQLWSLRRSIWSPGYITRGENNQIRRKACQQHSNSKSMKGETRNKMYKRKVKI